jgi:hypothetical protein
MQMDHMSQRKAAGMYRQLSGTVNIGQFGRTGNSYGFLIALISHCFVYEIKLGAYERSVVSSGADRAVTDHGETTPCSDSSPSVFSR